MPHNTGSASSRKRKSDKAEIARKILAGTTLRREDSDDELGIEDLPWEWIFSGEEAGSDEEVEEAISVKRKRGRPSRTISKSREREIIGARMGSFQCKVGDCVLLKAENNEAWAAVICEFLEEEDEKGATVMCEQALPRCFAGYV